MESVR